MPEFDSDYTGGVNDRVTLLLDGEQVLISESYEVHQAILQQPGVFSLRLGTDTVAREILKKYPPNTPFALRIGSTQRMLGWTDGTHARGKAMALDVKGRDVMSILGGFIQVEKTFVAKTYLELTQRVLERVGFKGTVITTNADNRKVLTGTDVLVLDEEEGTLDEVDAAGPQGSVFRQMQARVGERWHHFLKRELDRAGLFVWPTADGNVCLSRPNAKQKPTYRIVRKRGQAVGACTIEDFDYSNDTAGRFSEAVVYGRYGGKKYGRAKSKGGYVDQEMVDWGFNRPFVAHDVNVANEQQAAFYASRKLAEFRRAGWSLQYTVAGHSVPAIGGGRAVWAPDTVVDVQDDELGLYGPYYVESVTFRRPPTTTTLVLQRPEDLLYGLTE